MAYHYLDIMKRVLPYGAIPEDQKADSAGFYVFGSYDLLYIDNEKHKSISDMKLKHEERHEVSWQYERQPVFFYCQDFYDNKFEEVVNTGGNYNEHPLVITLVQLDKKKLVKENRYTIRELLENAQEIINSALADNRQSKNDASVVAWNLGGTDLLIFSRTKKLVEVAHVLARLQTELVTIDESPLVFSMSSHCAIAYRDALDLQDNCFKWIKNDDSVELNAFVETASGFDGILGYNDHFDDSQTVQMILGERDYRLVQKASGDNSDRNEKTLRLLLDMQYNYARDEKDPYAYYASYVVPSITVDNLTHALDDPAVIVWEDKDGSGFNILENIASSIETNIDLYGNNAISIAELIRSVRRSLLGLRKYAFRLEASIQQHDLYCRVEKLYGVTEEILGLYIKKIGTSEIRERAYIDEMLASLKTIITELQHLFTVLALSPHTYIETFSSSMRSLNAASKLWSAYNGCIDAMKELLCDGDQRCEVLLTPYRDRSSSNSLMFAKASEQSTFILIQMNFAQMFDRRQAVFMLAHEMGHHLGDHLREERIKFMTRYLLGQCMRRIAGPMVRMPLYNLVKNNSNTGYYDEDEINEYTTLSQVVFISEEIEKERGAGDLKSLCTLIPADNKSDYERIKIYERESSALREVLKSKLHKLIDKFSKEFKKEYKKTGMFKYDYKAQRFFAEPVSNAYKSFILELLKNNQDCIADRVREAVLEYLNGLNEEFDTLQVINLKAEWNTWQKETNPELFSEEDVDESKYKAIKLFREIHADIVAARTLGIQPMDDYLDHTNDPGAITGIFEDGINMMRIFAVVHTVYNNGDMTADSIRKTMQDIYKWMISKSNHPKDIIIRGVMLLFDFATCIYPEAVLEYAMACDKAVTKRIAEKANDPNLKKIRNWYKSDKESIDDLWYLWKLSMS